MARARVELRGALTHTRGHRTFTKGAPQVLTDDAELAYYKAQSQFSVTMLEEPKPAPAAAGSAKGSPGSATGGKAKAKASDEEPPL